MTLRRLKAVFKVELDHTRLAAVAHGFHDHRHRSNLERLSAGEHELVRSKHGFESVGKEAGLESPQFGSTVRHVFPCVGPPILAPLL